MWKWIARWQSSAGHRVDVPAPEPKRPSGKVSGKYLSLYTYLENRYANTVFLTFSQIEDLLGFALPDLARTQQEWWTTVNTGGEKSPWTDAWRLAGRAATPNLPAQTVAFERTVSPRQPLP